MSLEKEFGIPQAAIVNLVRKGVITPGVINKYEMLAFYKSKFESGVCKAESVKLTSEQFNVSCTYVYKVIQEIG